jgi:hypothetical protein
MKAKHVLAAAAMAAFAVPAAASAATVTIQNIVASWSGAVGGTAVNFPNNNTLSPSARWGADQGFGQSGYDFVATPSAINVVVPPSPSGDFVLGTFAHVNEPIGSGTSISAIVLSLTAQVFIDAIDQGTRNFVFNFTHDETPNGANPCAFGGANGVGVNINGCADRVTVGFNNMSESFTIGSDVYTLNIRGFDVGGIFTTEFLTIEERTNGANLLANVTLRSDVAVPEPLSLALFGTALAGLGLMRRRRPA